ncbi:uracil phosphoribosyltransferase [Thalassotalea insulae]|uniref:Uracil phosphoribosyltransferase n=1 Tax=Thalassotalea insulae TaxID=2056778 RepID=A0ABQ6GLI0_9GAMM|nr:uracil phosphoribosyltransferase [Thalassotalea insulae]GLX76858.1 uracil phosphoribosyltransferase [Thalassotalea insulae]
MSVYASTHPLVQHKVSLLRDAQISVKSFRELTKELATLLAIEATASLKVEAKPLTCWSGTISTPMLAEKQPTLVPILRAGLGMLDGTLAVLPCAKVSVVGLKRNDDSVKLDANGKVDIAIESYYQNIISDVSERKAIIIDPMLATGGSAIACINMLKASGCTDICALFLVAAPEGIEALTESHPDVDIFVAAIDEKLNDQGYILPGLGDAGDKIFGTL